MHFRKLFLFILLLLTSLPLQADPRPVGPLKIEGVLYAGQGADNPTDPYDTATRAQVTISNLGSVPIANIQVEGVFYNSFRDVLYTDQRIVKVAPSATKQVFLYWSNSSAIMVTRVEAIVKYSVDGQWFSQPLTIRTANVISPAGSYNQGDGFQR